MSRPRRRGRDINGVLLLDKPQGMSSNCLLYTSTDDEPGFPLSLNFYAK